MCAEKVRALSDNPLPDRIVLGVTGHRYIDHTDRYAEKIDAIIEKISALILPHTKTPVSLCILSPLAEGADRLVAKQILSREDSQLEVVLPLEKEAYLEDFKSPDSREEFERLLSKAVRVHKIPHQKNREEAYARAGEYVVDNCDILIALWDGKKSSGRGGTAEIVQYARANQRPLYWINTQTGGEIAFEAERKKVKSQRINKS